MNIGAWHQGERAELPIAAYKVLDNTLELFWFAQQIAAWIPDGDWKLLIADNSNVLAKDESVLLYQGTLSPTQVEASNKLFRFGAERGRNFESNVATVCAIFIFLIFEGYTYLISSNSSDL